MATSFARPSTLANLRSSFTTPTLPRSKESDLTPNIRDDDKLAGKIDSDDKENIEIALKDALEWLDDNPNAEKLDYDEKMAELEVVFNPIIRRAYESSDGSSADSEDESNYDL